MDSLSLLENTKLSGTLSVLGVPLDLGKETSGTAAGPYRLRELGLFSVMRGIGYSVDDLGSVFCPGREAAEMGDLNLKYLDAILPVMESVAKQVAGEIEKQKKVLVVGGDNTISIGSISGAAKVSDEPVGVIWIDAHADINTHQTTLSGNIHGMPIASLLGLEDSALKNIGGPGQKIKPENLLYIGLRDAEQAELDFIRSLKIAAVTIYDISEQGLTLAFKKISELAGRVGKIWVCLDVDSIDSQFAPGTPMAAPGGLTYRESLALAKFIGKNCPVIGVDVSEYAPYLDENDKTAQLVLELVASYFGGGYGNYSKYMEEEIKKQDVRKNTGSVLTQH